MQDHAELLAPIRQFLHCETPDSWVEKASKPENLPILLKDHLLCELKAAQSAMFLIRKYAVDKESAAVLLTWFKPYEDFAYDRIGDIHSLKDKNQISKQILAKKQSPYSQDLIDKMVLLIKEELHHFYQVLEIMHQRNISYDGITASRYAKGLFSHMSGHEPQTLVDKLIIGAYIEARSCERFAKLAPFLDDDLANFYISLLRSEARHYQDYLKLAQSISKVDINERVDMFGAVEAELISSMDSDFKFHSGVPA
ncbi:tRNA isopentenyl-2-thiomethyl-A-37 hydroxylase MiaE [Providencia stuartii]|uniref:tRNA isopentenyl-2-thiomethyl-A-37 hydroxylase MiaE n=1 Tax=Providencia TaxID=586 RepID=UPI001121AA9F|nr:MULTISPECIES: tRNA isopentenyl-2-thiomethyl-A-37 hydroxylase MiaE [Providencia]ELR5040624.1 tRNA isopentenyl-2-thiomethyl-A-37 hydroxylase MiaE [Providencia stuartii]ELR5084190.1 tRNA isopentenyl-2-thiomethyl-A-37 hydroxylase MiaE [Providencia stuartii]ELR5302222.1 tRNA isopentenyl-2-thiomethyl-A-37 hydroxylase MiaE [Providencia stuartii]MDW7590692.1 tRNA isopentenyl-2-thiomethyl-A-37 hydroxylase MiaE [Providencia sp. 2023EL-00965]